MTILLNEGAMPLAADPNRSVRACSSARVVVRNGDDAVPSSRPVVELLSTKIAAASVSARLKTGATSSGAISARSLHPTAVAAASQTHVACTANSPMGGHCTLCVRFRAAAVMPRTR
jgi:hypothetical protein